MFTLTLTRVHFTKMSIKGMIRDSSYKHANTRTIHLEICKVHLRNDNSFTIINKANIKAVRRQRGGGGGGGGH